MDTRTELNEKILKITMTIRDQYPELSKYLEEMTVTIPNETNPEITNGDLKKYCDTLESMLSKYIAGHSLKK